MANRKLLIKDGERGRNRTFNLLIKSQLLCQLSYAPEREIAAWRIRIIASRAVRTLHQGGPFAVALTLAMETTPVLPAALLPHLKN